MRYISGPMMRLSGKIRVTKADGGAIPKEARVTLINNFGNAWIKSIGVRVGNQSVNLSKGVSYYWKTLVSNLLNYSDDVRGGSLRASGVYNSPEMLHGKPAPTGDNMHKIRAWPHLMEIRKRCANSKWVDFCTDINADFLRTRREFLNGTDVELIFHRNPDEFVLMRDKEVEGWRPFPPDNYTGEKYPTLAHEPTADAIKTFLDADARVRGKLRRLDAQSDETINSEDGKTLPNFTKRKVDNEAYKYELTDLILHVRKLEPSDKLLSFNNSRVLTSPAKYLVQEWQQNSFVLPAGQNRVTTTPLFGSRVPTRTVYIIVRLDAERGSYDTNPEILEPYNLRRFVQRVGGVPSPLEELEYDWDNEQFSVPFRMLLDNCGICTLNKSNGITYDSFKNHTFMIAYANSPMGVSSIADPNRSRVQKGSEVIAELTFDNRDNRTLLLLAFGITDSAFGLDQNRQLLYERETAI